MGVSVVGRQVQPRIPWVGHGELNVRRVVAGKAIVFAGIDSAVLLPADA